MPTDLPYPVGPRQNRVTPTSTIVAATGRGLFMGNRGCLHDNAGRVVRPWRGKLWITCLTEFKGRRRALMQPGHYTELFFLDEAVSFAAGHRPCAECRRADYLRFRAAWAAAGLPAAPRAGDMDRHLHPARLLTFSGPRQYAELKNLPDGSFVHMGGAACLWHHGQLLPYRPEGYGAPLPRPAAEAVPVLTPAPFLRILAAGYGPVVHPSAPT
ncbi:MAG TPA: hypothetical protein PK450_05075 [Paracoccaceae bacterium]|nr:hypothetical protein [Paracoccaceae bacterium]